MEERNMREILDGWREQNQSIIDAVNAISREQLLWKPAPDQRSIGGIARHIAATRLGYFSEFGRPGVENYLAQLPWKEMPDGSQDWDDADIPIEDDPAALSAWLSDTWDYAEKILESLSVEKLFNTFPWPTEKGTRQVPVQWTIFRMLHHDFHHGGEISLLLGLQGIEDSDLQTFPTHFEKYALADPEADSPTG